MVSLKGFDELDKALEEYFTAYELISDEEAERIEANNTELTAETAGRRITELMRAYNDIRTESQAQKDFQKTVDEAAKVFFKSNPEELTDESIELMAEGLMEDFEDKIGFAELYDALEEYFEYSE